MLEQEGNLSSRGPELNPQAGQGAARSLAILTLPCSWQAQLSPGLQLLPAPLPGEATAASHDPVPCPVHSCCGPQRRDTHTHPPDTSKLYTPDISKPRTLPFPPSPSSATSPRPPPKATSTPCFQDGGPRGADPHFQHHQGGSVGEGMASKRLHLICCSSENPKLFLKEKRKMQKGPCS